MSELEWESVIAQFNKMEPNEPPRYIMVKNWVYRYHVMPSGRNARYLPFYRMVDIQEFIDKALKKLNWQMAKIEEWKIARAKHIEAIIKHKAWLAEREKRKAAWKLAKAKRKKWLAWKKAQKNKPKKVIKPKVKSAPKIVPVNKPTIIIKAKKKWSLPTPTK